MPLNDTWRTNIKRNMQKHIVFYLVLLTTDAFVQNIVI